MENIIDVDIPASTFVKSHVAAELMQVFKTLPLDTQATLVHALASPALIQTLQIRHKNIATAMVILPVNDLPREKFIEMFTIHRLELLMLQDILAFLDQAKQDLKDTFPGIIQDRI